VFSDIFPDAVKVGMAADAGLIRVIARVLKKYQPEHVVVDPVMVSTSGSDLTGGEAVEELTRLLFPLAQVVTPNIPEAEKLWGRDILSAQEMQEAAERIGRKYGCSVLLKGGHLQSGANDYLWRPSGGRWFYGERIANPNTHGTGCTLSSAIASRLAQGASLEDAVLAAKKYLTLALADGLDLGKGNGPVNHGFAISDPVSGFM
ncbi:MAG: bifunctional hydroxymethylpyrimidine kinase/phosphomethylpyrimidine kinase, partial [Clostridiaceae bacterium]|nr:bifunctional hydroxymethylpyrimidine kinase/phosphomethylpyrimidine kinase [Clostridiaceae bacterium]